MGLRNFPGPLFFRQPILTWIVLVSIFVRMGAAIYLGDEVIDLPGTADQISYHNLAIRVLEGKGFSFDRDWWPLTVAGAPTAHWSFLYTFYLVFIYAGFGIHPLAARLVQAILVGALQPYLVYWIGRRIFNERTGLIAAWATAFYIYFIYYAGCLMTESAYITAILGLFALVVKLVKTEAGQVVRPAWTGYICLGILLGCVVLLRQLFLLIIPFIAVWMLWVRRTRFWETALRFGVSGGILLAMILPVTYYNFIRFNRVVLLNTNSGYAFYFGNHPIYGTKFVPILTESMGTYQELIPDELRNLDEAALDQELLKKGLQIVFSDPIRYILLSISRIPAYFEFWPSDASSGISNLSRVASFGIFLPFMLYGWIRTGIHGGLKKFSNPEWLFVLFMVVYTSIHLLSWALIRYRLPVDAVALLFAGVGINDLYERFWIRQPRGLLQKG